MGFCRLSLPQDSRDAMIREVHVYGKVANIGDSATNAQHLGLGTKLLDKATELAKNAGYNKLNVISAIGTREYYKARGFDHFTKNNLYQQKNLS